MGNTPAEGAAIPPVIWEAALFRPPILLAPCSVLALVGLVTLTAVQSAPAVPPRARPTGKQLFMQRCAGCHGAGGEGTRRYQKPLAGSQSVSQLAAYISRSMPPGPVKKCTGQDARSVAAYLYDAFYSPIAQARNKPARVELSRLTVRQYRNAVTDLLGSFRPAGRIEEKRGLRGEYFKSRRLDAGERALERIDPEVHFDWGQASPAGEAFDPRTFSMRWQGSVIAPDTGEYEIIVRTEHATRLWLNDARRPLIDAWVKSGNDNEYRGTVYLLGGRAYPLRLEFSKANQGVDDTAKLKDRPVAKASLSLEWRPPKRAVEVIPGRCLVPQSVPESFALTTPFPPDDRSLGYERGTSVSKAWDDAATEAALETVAYVARHLRELSGVPDDAPDRPARLREFCRQLAARAFRRPLTDELERMFVERQFQSAPDVETAVKRSVLLVLESPRFLYRELGSGGADAYDVASRLSFGLWDSLPDETLLKAAGSGELATHEQVVRQAERMVADPRAHAKLREFFLQWLKVDQTPDLAKDHQRFPGFDAAAASDLRTSLELTLEQVAWSPRSDYRELLQGDRLFLNGRLAKLYGVNLPPDAPFQAVSLEPSERAGVLTHPYLMASFAYVDNSSPIHRGVLIARNLLGRVLQPPPQAFAPLAAALHPNLTTRQRVALQTQPAACAGCHNVINPLGFTLEKFDAIGRLRTTENGQPIDASGSYEPGAGKAVRFAGARDLAAYLAGSDEAQTAFVEKLFQYLVKQPVRAYGPQAARELRDGFVSRQYSIRSQMVESVALAALKR